MSLSFFQRRFKVAALGQYSDIKLLYTLFVNQWEPKNVSQNRAWLVTWSKYERYSKRIFNGILPQLTSMCNLGENVYSLSYRRPSLKYRENQGVFANCFKGLAYYTAHNIYVVMSCHVKHQAYTLGLNVCYFKRWNNVGRLPPRPPLPHPPLSIGTSFFVIY